MATDEMRPVKRRATEGERPNQGVRRSTNGERSRQGDARTTNADKSVQGNRRISNGDRSGQNAQRAVNGNQAANRERRQVNGERIRREEKRPVSERLAQEGRHKSGEDRTRQTERRPVNEGGAQEGRRKSGEDRTRQAERRPADERAVQERRRQANGERASQSAKRVSAEANAVHSRNAKRAQGGKNRNPNGKKSNTGKIIAFVIEAIVLVVMIAVLWTVIKTEKVGKVEIKEEDIIINEEVKNKMETTSNNTENGSEGEGEAAEESVYSKYRNIALFGVDSREGALTKNTRSDTIIIASINEETGDVKLVSVYRDTYLNLSNDSYNKCNAAYAKGGPKQAINMLNMNLDLDITDFVTIGFDGLIDVIDAIGGVEVNVLDSEIVHLNNYQISMVGTSKDGETFTANAGSDYTPVSSAGVQVLNGLQATAYCRIRYVGNDFQRAERQRAVIQAIVDKAKKNPANLASVAETMFKEVYTSLDLTEILSLLEHIADYQIVDEGGFPEESMRGCTNVGSKGSCVIPVDLTSNVKWLHEFLFNETDYDPSSAVKSYSVKIYEDVSPYM